jgi:hypothetical protein
VNKPEPSLNRRDPAFGGFLFQAAKLIAPAQAKVFRILSIPILENLPGV